MSCVSNQQYLAYAEAGGASLLQFVWTHTDEFVLVGLGMARENLLIAKWLAFDELFLREILRVTVCHSPQTVISDLGSHIPVGGVNYEV
jgi:hypothetical protein